jgi:hypothetical protein
MSITFSAGMIVEEGEVRVAHAWPGVDEMNCSNANARAILTALGLPADECGTFNLKAAAAMCHLWLQAHIDAPDLGVPTTVERGALGAIMIDFGIPQGYLNRRIHELSVIAGAGIALGATHLIWA